MFDQRRCPPLHSFCVCADYSICMWLGNTITILCPHLLLFLSLCGGDCMYLFYQSVDIPARHILAKTKIHPHEIEGNGIGSSLPLYKSKDHHECRKKIPFRNKKKRESLSILGVYTTAFFFFFAREAADAQTGERTRSAKSFDCSLFCCCTIERL